MESYGEFAFVYDRLINQDYSAIADKIEDIFRRNGVKPELVLDLACGTGSLTVELAKRGYDMIGIDMSEEMLSVAYEKASEYPDVRFLCQDMTEFELYGTVDAIVCTLDAVNYITDKRDLKRLFKIVHNYLNPGGLFIFDINTVYKLKTVLGNNTFVYDENGVFYTWENYFNPKNNISEQFLTFFAEQDGMYKRFDEQHVQRGYTESELRDYMENAGLAFVEKVNWVKVDCNSKKAEKIIFVSKKFC